LFVRSTFGLLNINQVPGYKMINMINTGQTESISLEELENLGFKLALYPVNALNAAIAGMQHALKELQNTPKSQAISPELPLTFAEIKEIVGFNQYSKEESKYK